MTLTDQAFQFAKSRGLIEDSACVEASATMWNYVKTRGGNAELRRYLMHGEEDGHWTVVTDDGEFDPTIGCWSAKKRNYNNIPFSIDAKCGELYRVTPESPHRTWKQDPHIYYDNIVDAIEYE